MAGRILRTGGHINRPAEGHSRGPFDLAQDERLCHIRCWQPRRLPHCLDLVSLCPWPS